MADMRPACRSKSRAADILAAGRVRPNGGPEARCPGRRRTARLPSFADAKLSKYGIENLFDIDCPDNFADGAQRVVQIDRNIFGGECLLHRCPRAIACVPGAPQTLAMTRIDRYSAFRTQILFHDAGEHFVLEFAQTFPRRARNPQAIEIFPVAVLRQIAFVQHNDLVAVTGAIFKMRRLRRIAIRDVQKQIGRLQRFFRARDSFALESAYRSSQAGRIEQTNRHPAQIDTFLDCVARGSVRFAHNDAFVTQQPIEQTRFASVGGAINYDTHTFTENAALVRRGEQVCNFSANRIKSGAKLSAFVRSDPFFGEVNRGFDLRDKINKCVADFLDSRAKPAFELLGGRAQGEIGFGTNQIDDRLGLSEIHLAVEKSALGKFARPCAARPRAQTSFENFGADQCAAVTTDLDQIFARVSGWCPMDRYHHLIDQASLFIGNFAKMLYMRSGFRWLLFAAKNFICDCNRVFT